MLWIGEWWPQCALIIVLSCCFKELDISFMSDVHWTHLLSPIFLSSTLGSSRRKVRQHPSARWSGFSRVWDDFGCSCGGRHGHTHLGGVVLQGWKLCATRILPQTQSPNAQEPPELSESTWLLKKQLPYYGTSLFRAITQNKYSAQELLVAFVWTVLFLLSDHIRWSWAAQPRQRMTRPGEKSLRRSRWSLERRCCCCRRREPWRASRPRNSSALVSLRSTSPLPRPSFFSHLQSWCWSCCDVWCMTYC